MILNHRKRQVLIPSKPSDKGTKNIREPAFFYRYFNEANFFTPIDPSGTEFHTIHSFTATYASSKTQVHLR